jgi:hypothetical protein
VVADTSVVNMESAQDPLRCVELLKSVIQLCYVESINRVVLLELYIVVVFADMESAQDGPCGSTSCHVEVS